MFWQKDEIELSIKFDLVDNIKLNNYFIDIETDEFIYKFVSKDIQTIYTSIERTGKLIKKLI